MQQYLEVCKAVTTHGVAGEVKVELWCDDAAFLGRFKRLYRGPQGQNPIAVTKVRAHKNMALVTFEGVNDMDAARALVGQVFYIDRADAKLPRGHYFQADLLGCRLIDAERQRLRRDHSGEPPRRTGYLYGCLPGWFHCPVPGGEALPGKNLH